jgi:hypothetical protein
MLLDIMLNGKDENKHGYVLVILPQLLEGEKQEVTVLCNLERDVAQQLLQDTVYKIKPKEH